MMFLLSTHLTTPETLTSSPVTPQENLGGSARLWRLRDIREMPDLRAETSLAIRDICNMGGQGLSDNNGTSIPLA